MPPSSIHRIVPLRRPGIRAWLDTASPFADALETALETIAAIPPGFTPIPTRSRSRRIWEGRLDGIPVPLVVKQGWVDPSYPLDRRMVRRVSLALEHPFRRALDISASLDAIGFPAARPVLCWKKGPGLCPSEEGILYPKVEASGSLRRYLHDPGTGNPFDRRLRLPPETLAALGRFLRTLNAAGFVHLDPTPQNILLRPGAADPPTEADFTFIDVEAFRPMPAGESVSPRARRVRSRALSPLLPYLPSADLPLFAEQFALPSESPSSWLPVFLLLHRNPVLSLSVRLRLDRLARSF